MRLAISSLILAAGLATSAQAQEPGASPTWPTPQASPAPAAPALAAPAPEVAPAPAAPAPAAPATEAAPAPAPAPAAEPAPPPPALPTSGDGATVLSVLEKVCVPLVRGGSLETLAKPLGMRLNRREGAWAMPLGTNRAHQVIVYPTGSNRDVCRVEIRHAVGQDAPITSALNIWSFVHQPPLDPTANYTQPQDPDGLKRVRRSWESLSANSSIGLNISTVTNPDGSPVNKAYGLATMQYQERKF